MVFLRISLSEEVAKRQFRMRTFFISITDTFWKSLPVLSDAFGDDDLEAKLARF